MMTLNLRAKLVVSAGLVGLISVAGTGAAFADQSVRGEGIATAKLAPITESVIVEIRSEGDGPVKVKPVLRGRGKTFAWVNSVGPWAGTVFQEQESKPVIAARVTAPGPWSIVVKPLARAPKVTRGINSQVIQLKKRASGTLIKKFTFQGQGLFKVFPISAKGMSGFSLIDQAGPFTGKAYLPPGTKYVSVVATGPWQMN
jgi:hypothetical protein